ncbi:MAG TPA: hypothetical protein VK171_04355, partial [Fimbriimonas sp.]|nr:hypothetical protein [Fimbriimonas sp.]
ILDNYTSFDGHVETIEEFLVLNPSVNVLLCSNESFAFRNASTITIRPISAGDTNTLQSFFSLLARRFDRVISAEQLANLAPLIRSYARQPLSALLLAFLASNSIAVPMDSSSTALTEAAQVRSGQDQLLAIALRHLDPIESEMLSALTLFDSPPSIQMLESVCGNDLGASVLSLERLGLINLIPTSDGLTISIRRDLQLEVASPSTAAQERYVSEFTSVSNTIKLLGDLGEWAEAVRGLLSHAKDLGNAVELSAKINRLDLASSIYMNIGRLTFEADLKEDYKRLSASIGSVASDNLPFEVRIEKLGLDGAIALMSDDFDLCRALWQERLDTAIAADDKISIADSLSDIDALEFELGNFAEAISMTIQAEAAAIEAQSPDLLASALAIRSHSYVSLGELVNGERILQQVLDLLPLCHSDRFGLFVYQNCVVILDKLNRSDESDLVLQELLERSRKNQRVILEGWSLVRLSDRMVARNDLPQARKLLEDAVQLYRTTSAKHYLRTKATLERLDALA